LYGLTEDEINIVEEKIRFLSDPGLARHGAEWQVPAENYLIDPIQPEQEQA
jgi:hypothetical protein